MSDKTMAKQTLIYLLYGRNAKAKILNQAIKETNACYTHKQMLNVYFKYEKLTR